MIKLYKVIALGTLLASNAMFANSASTWIREAGMVRYRFNVTQKYEYDYYYFRNQITDTASGYQSYTSWVNPNNSWSNNNPGPAYTEESDYTSETTATNYMDYEYDSRWGINVDVTSPGGATIDAEIDYKERDSDGTLGSTVDTHDETIIVAPGTFLGLWSSFKKSQGKYVSAVTVTITP